MSPVKAAVISIDTERASELLLSQKRNRPLRRGLVAKYLHQMREGNWRISGEAIIVSDKDRLIDGQHRLAALLEYGKPLDFLVVEGVEDEVSKVLDTGGSRSASDVIFMFDGAASASEAVVAATATRWLYMYEKKEMYSRMQERNMPSPEDLLDLIKKRPGMIEAVKWSIDKRKQLPGFREGLMAFCYYVINQVNQQEARTFFGKLISGANLNTTDSIYQLRERIIRSQKGTSRWVRGNEYVALVFKAWNLYKTNTPVSLLSWKSGVETFPNPTDEDFKIKKNSLEE